MEKQSGLVKDEQKQIAIFTEKERRWRVLEETKRGLGETMWQIAEEQGSILREINMQLGQEGLLAFCENVNISRRTAYNYMKLSENGNNEFLRSLAVKRAEKFLPLMNSGDVTFEKDRLIFGDGMELTLDEAQSMSREQLFDLLKTLKTLTKQSSTTEKLIKDITDKNHKEIEILREKLARAEAAVIERGEATPTDLMIADLGRHIEATGKLIDGIRAGRLTLEQSIRMTGLMRTMKNLVELNFKLIERIADEEAEKA